MWSYHTIRELAVILSDEATTRSFQRTFLSSKRDFRGSLLLDAVLAASVKHDDDARSVLGDNTTSKSIFRAFKFRFIEELLNCYLTLDLPDGPDVPSDVIRYRITIIREASLMLNRLGHRLVALSVLHNAIQSAAQYGMADEMFMLTRALNDLVPPNSSVSYDGEQYAVQRSFLHGWRSETEAEGLLQYADICHYTNIADNVPLAQTLASAIDRMHATFGNALTDHARRNLAFVELELAALRGDAQLVEHLRQTTVVAHVDDVHGSTALDAIIRTRTARALMQLRRVYDALDTLSVLPATAIERGPMWQTFQETLIVAHLHDHSFEKAMGLWNDADAIRRSQRLKTSQRDHAWSLLGGYLALLERLQKTGGARRSTAFRLRSFLNSLPRPIHPDLRIGLPYLTLEIAFAIATYDYDLAQRRIEYAVITVARSSRIDAYEPYMAFVELLRDLVTCRFDAARVRGYSAKHLQKLTSLRSTPLPTLTAEIIPFETLYEMIIEMIEHNDRTS